MRCPLTHWPRKLSYLLTVSLGWKPISLWMLTEPILRSWRRHYSARSDYRRVDASVNPLRAKFFHSHFLSLLHIDKTQVVEILARVRQGPTLHCQYHGCWRSGDTMSKDQFSPCTLKVNQLVVVYRVFGPEPLHEHTLSDDRLRPLG